MHIAKDAICMTNNKENRNQSGVVTHAYNSETLDAEHKNHHYFKKMFKKNKKGTKR